MRGHAQELERALRDREGRPYPAYHDVEGAWAFSEFLFILERAQSDLSPRRPAAACRSDDEHCSCGHPCHPLSLAPPYVRIFPLVKHFVVVRTCMQS